MLQLSQHLSQGARSARDLTQSLGVNRSTLTRAYKRESSALIRIGKARATRYAARHILPGLSTDQFPLFRVDRRGRITSAGQLFTLVGGQSLLLPEEMIVDGLPLELHDIAPAGFLGHNFTQCYSELALPDDPKNWSDHHVLVALTRRGEDLPGNLVVGAESFDRWQRLDVVSQTTKDFVGLAEAALSREAFGSSAGGEQPKFTCFYDGHHSIVKFANNATENSRRWQDLLLLEHLALRALGDHNIPTAQTTIVDQDNWRFLVVRRFDRDGERGRVPVLTLSAATESITGTWSEAANQLHNQTQLSQDHANQIALLDAYGAQIGNTDRHLFNVLLYPTGPAFELAPAFDQLPMGYAPTASGNMRNEVLDQARPTAQTLPVWEDAREIATLFWREAKTSTLQSIPQRVIDQHLAILQT